MAPLDITSLEAKAKAVVQQSIDLETAISDEQEQRIALMAVVLDKITPALPSLVSKIQTYRRSERDRDQAKYHERKGLRIDGSGKNVGPVGDDGVRGGALTGWDRFLLEDGSLLDLHYAGAWGENNTAAWYVEGERTESADDLAVYIVGEDSDKAAIRAISYALDRQLEGKARNRIKTARERAEKIKAILTLLSMAGAISP